MTIYQIQPQKQFTIEFVDTDQIWQDETTNYWFVVDGESYAISDNNGFQSLLDSDGEIIIPRNDHDGVFNAIMQHRCAPEATNK